MAAQTRDPGSTRVSAQTRLTTLSVMVMSVAGALLAIAVVAWMVLDPDTPFEAGRLLIALGIVVCTAIVGRMVGLRVSPLRANLAPERATDEAVSRITTISYAAFALAEAGGLLCFALGFVLPMSRLSVVCALVVSAIGTLWAALPAGPRLRSLVATLESEGAHTGLAS